MLISSTTFEKFKIDQFLLFQCHLVGIKILFKKYFHTYQVTLRKLKTVNFEFLKSGQRYQQQIFTSCQPLEKSAFCKKSRSQVFKIWISHQKCKELLMGIAGPIFELHPSNLVRIHMFLSCKNAENFVIKSQVVLELAKISVSVLSIS